MIKLIQHGIAVEVCQTVILLFPLDLITEDVIVEEEYIASKLDEDIAESICIMADLTKDDLINKYDIKIV